MEESWENLAGALPGLNISERPNTTSAPAPAAVDTSSQPNDVTKPPTPPPAESNPAQAQHQTQQQFQGTAVPEYETVDSAIRQALADPNQRVTVLKCEELVEKFLADNCQETLQFPASFTSYQRMLAHRVGQYYGLQTSTVDYEDSQGRVIAIRLKSCYEPKPRLRSMEIRNDPVAQRPVAPNGMDGGPVADKPRLLRRQDEDRSQQTSSEHSLNQSPVRSMKERQENYYKAREELGLGSGPQDGMGGRGGRGGPGGRFGSSGGRMDGGRGRKAVFRDKDKDLSDPDYRRGMNRFNGAARFDPSYAAMQTGGLYQVPAYSSEFPALNNRMMGAGAMGAHAGRPQMQQHQAHQVAAGAQPHPMSGPVQPQSQAPGHGPWKQQQSQQQQGQGGVRPPPPPPPHQSAGGGMGSSTGGGGGGGGPSGTKGHHPGGGSNGGPMGSAVGRQQQHAQAGYSQAMAATPFPGVAAQYPMPVALGATGFVPAPPGQPMFGMATSGGTIPGAMYAPAPGVGGAFYPSVGVGMGMGAVGMAMPAAGAYGYMAAPAPGVGMGMGSSGEAIAIAPQAAYPVYASYPAGAAMYPAAAAQMPQAAAIHHAAGGAAMPMRPVYGIPSFYPQYDPSQYATAGMQGDGRMYGGYGGHHGHQHHGGPHGQHHGSGAMGSHSGGRGRDSDNGARGEPRPGAAGGAAAGADGK